MGGDPQAIPTADLAAACAPTFPLDDSEQERLRVLRAFEVLDTAPEAAFDNLTLLAAQLCDTPMALVSLVDAERQWFKSRRGVSLDSTPREQSFCAHALHSPEVLLIPDTWEDPRFVDNPLVTGSPHLRFYAGAPLITSEGYALGTLCVLDTVPRQLGERQIAQLRILAAQAVGQLELRRQTRLLAEAVHARHDAVAALREQQRMLDGLLQHTDVLIYAKDRDGRFVMTNPAVERATQVEGGLLGRTDLELFAEPAEKYRRNDMHIMKTREWQVFIEELVHPDGCLHTYRSTKFPLLDDAGEVIGVAGVSTDVTELAAARAAHQEAEERWRALVEQSPAAVSVIGADGRIEYANPQAVALCGASGLADVEQHLALAFVARHDDNARRARAAFETVLAGGSPLLAYRCVLQQVDGTLVTVELNATAVTYRGSPAVQLEFRDVTAAAAAHAALEHFASTDPLTGALNRRAWESQLGAVLDGARHTGAPLTVAVIDLDHFKVYNDTFGHDAGDELLRRFAAAARLTLRSGDVFARWGGEEFIVALPDTTAAQAAEVLDRLRSSVPADQTCSIGYTAWPAGESLGDTVSRADQALYRAKRLGRNRIVQA